MSLPRPCIRCGIKYQPSSNKSFICNNCSQKSLKNIVRKQLKGKKTCSICGKNVHTNSAVYLENKKPYCLKCFKVACEGAFKTKGEALIK